jgi:hypothetical protein
VKKAPEKYEQPKPGVPIRKDPNTDRPTFPSLAMPDPPTRKTMRGAGAAVRGKSFYKDG